MLKYGLGVYAPETPVSFVVPGKSESLDVTKASETKIIFAPGVTELVIDVAAGVRATLIEELPSDRAVAIDLKLAQGAVVTYVSNQNGVGTLVAQREATLATDASLTWRESFRKTAFARVFTVTTLAGERAQVSAQTTFSGGDSDFLDLRHEAVHMAPRTSSDLRLRGVLDGSARAVVRGLIRIGPGLPGCVGRQKEEILLLSDRASVAAMPDLEVASHEVQCGHAAAIGRPNPEKLYYMESRGLTPDGATRLYAEGFLADANLA